MSYLELLDRIKHLINWTFQILATVVYLGFFYWVASMGLLYGLEVQNHKVSIILFYYVLFGLLTWIIYKSSHDYLLRRLVKSKLFLVIILLVGAFFRFASINQTGNFLVGFEGDNHHSKYLTLNANKVFYEELSDREAPIQETKRSGFYFEEDNYIIFIQLYPYPEYSKAKKEIDDEYCSDEYQNKGRFVYSLNSMKMYDLINKK
jgi:hypothetical protein